jgi:hypothetical protein
MVQQVINTGSVAGDGTGSRGQVPWQAFNANSTELYKNAYFFGIDSGAVNAYVVTLANLLPQPAVSFAPTSATIIRFTPNTPNTGPSTLAFAGNAAAPIVNQAGGALAAGQLTGLTTLAFNGSAWQIQALSQAQTAAEIAASVTPTNFGYAPLNPFRYGADGTGGANDAAALAKIQLVQAQITGINAWLNGMAVAGFEQTSTEAGNSVTPTFYINKFIPTPKRYGATGGGSTDDTAALVKWVNSGYENLELDDATYLTTGFNISRSPIRIYGNGPNSKILVSGAAGSYGIQIVTAGQAGTVGSALSSIAATHFGGGVQFRDFRIMCNATANQIYGLWLNNAEITSMEQFFVDLTGNTFAGAARNATYGVIAVFAQDGVWRKCHFTSGGGANSDGFFLSGFPNNGIPQSNNVFFEACRVQSCAGFGFRNGTNDGVNWYGGKLQNNGLGGWCEQDDGFGNGPSETLIEAAGFEFNSGSDILANNGNRLTVRGNSFQSTGATNHVQVSFAVNARFERNFSFAGKPVNLAGGSNIYWGEDNLGFGALTYTGGVVARASKLVVTYSANMSLPGTSSYFKITATNGVAFTVNLPPLATASDGQIILVDILNASGGALGAITWAGNTGTVTFTAPANGKRRTIQFYYDNATGWVQAGGAQADI